MNKEELIQKIIKDNENQELFLVRDPIKTFNGNTYNFLMLTINPYRKFDVGGYEWEAYNSFHVHSHLFPEVAWEIEPIPVSLEKIDETEINDDTIWLGRNKNGSFVISYNKLQRNSVNPWWSASDKFKWNSTELFHELSWEMEPIPVKIVKK